MRNQRGFTYLGVLLAIALASIGITAASELWVTTANRQKISHLEWVGQQFVQAIGSYYESTPGRVKTYPPSMRDLLEDRRLAFTRRHLRQVYLNPFTGRDDWELVPAPGGGIRGVRAKTHTGAASTTLEFIYVPVKG